MTKTVDLCLGGARERNDRRTKAKKLTQRRKDAKRKTAKGSLYLLSLRLLLSAFA
jgi:hypothetical protein